MRWWWLAPAALASVVPTKHASAQEGGIDGEPARAGRREGPDEPTSAEEREGPGELGEVEGGNGSTEFRLFPGAATAISRGLSASRDTPSFAWAMTPYTVVTVGGDLAIFSVAGRGLTFRLGLWGALELESSQPFSFSESGFSGLFPMTDVALWRGLNGLSLSLSFDERMSRWRERSALEVVLSYRHESEHYSGGGGEPEIPWRGVPHIGDFLMPEVAVRLPVGPVDFDLRLQLKVFFPRGNGFSYLVGPGLDAVVRWRMTSWGHLFTSLFFEYLVGGELEEETGTRQVPDNYLVRNLTGIVFPGRIADLSIFLSLALGHGKGLLAFNESFRFGGGFRIIVPSMAGRPRSRREAGEEGGD